MTTTTEEPVPIFIDCFPLESILAAINVKEIDFLSLDVAQPAQNEYKILKAVPFDKIEIKVSN